MPSQRPARTRPRGQGAAAALEFGRPPVPGMGGLPLSPHVHTHARLAANAMAVHVARLQVVAAVVEAVCRSSVPATQGACQRAVAALLACARHVLRRPFSKVPVLIRGSDCAPPSPAVDTDALVLPTRVPRVLAPPRRRGAPAGSLQKELVPPTAQQQATASARARSSLPWDACLASCDQAASTQRRRRRAPSHSSATRAAASSPEAARCGGYCMSSPPSRRQHCRAKVAAGWRRHWRTWCARRSAWHRVALVVLSAAWGRSPCGCCWLLSAALCRQRRRRFCRRLVRAWGLATRAWQGARRARARRTDCQPVAATALLWDWRVQRGRGRRRLLGVPRLPL